MKTDITLMTFYPLPFMSNSEPDVMGMHSRGKRDGHLL